MEVDPIWPLVVAAGLPALLQLLAARRNHEWRAATTWRRLGVVGLLVAVALQIVLGIVNVIYGSPLHAALTHQLGAVLLFVLVIRARHHARYPYETSVRGTIR